MNEKLLYFKSWLASKWINLCGDATTDFKSILIIKLDEIGDLVTALPVFYNLHQKYPNAKQTLLCKNFNTIFFKHLNYVSCITDLNQTTNHFYDLIVDLRGNQQTLNFAWKNKPKLRLDRGSIRFKNKFAGGQKNEIDTNLEVIKPLLNENIIRKNKIVTEQIEHAKITDYLAHQGISNMVILHVGARDKARRWPVDRFAEVINYINETYSMPCLLVGGPDDKQLNDQCLEYVMSKHNYNVVGEFNLLEYAALCEKSTLFIGNESGPLHIAAAQNTPTIALFGPGVKKRILSKNDKSIVHHYFLARGHKKQTLQNSTIFSIKVSEVLTSVNKMLDNFTE